MLAYWLRTDRRCNLTAIRSQKGLVIVDFRKGHSLSDTLVYILQERPLVTGA